MYRQGPNKRRPYKSGNNLKPGEGELLLPTGFAPASGCEEGFAVDTDENRSEHNPPYLPSFGNQVSRLTLEAG